MRQDDTPESQKPESAFDPEWAAAGVVAGATATIAYPLLLVLPGPPPLIAGVAFTFAAALTVGSIALHQLMRLGGSAFGPLSLLGAASNALAGALFVAMVLVQLAIREVVDPPPDELEAVYWGLDVAWDLYIGAGTLAFAIASLRVQWVGYALAAVGGVVSLALITMNLLTFPEPPASAGLLDVGPLVGLWYTAITVRLALTWRFGRT